jgi:hypothetical protein
MPKLFVLLLLPIVGCAAGAMPPLTPDNPASPEAAEAPLARGSDTLALPSKDDGSTSPRKAPAAEMSGGHGGGHAHH